MLTPKGNRDNIRSNNFEMIKILKHVEKKIEDLLREKVPLESVFTRRQKSVI